MRLWLITPLLLVISISCQAEIYQWVDDNGKVHFSDTRPPNLEASEISTPYPDKAAEENYNAFRNNLDLQLLKTQHQLDHQAAKTGNIDHEKISDPLHEVAASPVNLIFHSQSFEINESKQQLYTGIAVSVYQLLAEDFGWYFDAPFEISVRILNEQEIRSYKDSIRNRFIRFGNGYYRNRKEIIIMTRPTVSENYIPASLAHEVSHAIAHHAGIKLPNWLNEGIAERMTTMATQKPIKPPSTRHKHADWLKTYYQRDDLPTLRGFVDLPYEVWRDVDNNRRWYYYLSSWSLVQFMLEDPERKQILLAMIEESRIQGDHINEHAVIDKHYSLGSSFFEREWLLWIQDL